MYVPLFQDNHITGRRFVTRFLERYMYCNKITMKEVTCDGKLLLFLNYYIHLFGERLSYRMVIANATMSGGVVCSGICHCLIKGHLVPV